MLWQRGKTITAKPKRDKTKEIAEELDMFDTMLSALVELLEEKGIVAQKDWEERIRVKMMKASGMKSYRDLQFSSKP